MTAQTEVDREAKRIIKHYSLVHADVHPIRKGRCDLQLHVSSAVSDAIRLKLEEYNKNELAQLWQSVESKSIRLCEADVRENAAKVRTRLGFELLAALVRQLCPRSS